MASHVRFEPCKCVVDKESGGDGHLIALVNDLIKVKVSLMVGEKALKSLNASTVGFGLFKLIPRVFLSLFLLLLELLLL